MKPENDKNDSSEQTPNTIVSLVIGSIRKCSIKTFFLHLMSQEVGTVIDLKSYLVKNQSMLQDIHC